MLLIFANGDQKIVLSLRQAFLLTPLSWISIALFSALPFYFADIDLDFTRAFFEALSGVTTTGSTVMTGLDNAPPGILLWRSILQFLGGIGIIAAATAILPMLGVGGMQLFKTETSDSSQKFLPRATQIASTILSIYLTLFAVCALLYHWFGMSWFDAINHSMTTIATAGFSTHDASMAYFENANIELVAIIFMLSGALPFVAYYKMMGGDFRSFKEDSQIKFFLTLTAILVFLVSMWVYLSGALELPWKEDDATFLDSFRYAAFNVVSIITTTGYANADYGTWGTFPVVVFFLLMSIGGCTGSTSGGIKIFRLQILYETAKAQVNRLINPHGIFRPQYHGKKVSEDIVTAVLSYFVLFALAFSTSAVILSFTGLDFLTAMSVSIATVGNIGPALGEIAGPSGNYSSLSDFALWVCCFNMLLGRLEIFILIVLLSPNFWRN